MHAISKAIPGRVGPSPLSLLALVFVSFVAAAEPQGTAAEVRSNSFCELPSASEVLKRVGDAPPARGIKLVLSKEEVKPGGVVKARLVNFDEEVATYGAEFKIQRYGPAGWKTDPSSPSGPWPRYLGKLQPGKAGRCYSFSVPADQSGGRFRFSTMVGLGAKQLEKTGEFRVR
jgi:hypothetical protein